MTNSEYFEKHGISFSESMEIFNEQKSKKGGTKSFDKFLVSEYKIPCKFKIGDLVVLQLNEKTRLLNWRHNVVFEIVDIGQSSFGCGIYISVKYLTPETSGDWKCDIGDIQTFWADFIEHNCIKY